MKGPVRDSATFSFNAAARTVTFAAPIPAQQAYILGILNVTRNTFIYLPVKPGSGGTYNSGTGVLTLAFDTTTHANGDVLQIVFDDAQSGATAELQATGNASLSSIDAKIATGNTNTAGIRTDLGTDGTSPPTLPGSSTGVKGWLRWLGQSAFEFGAGAITAITLRFTLASDSPGVASLSSIDSKTPANPATSALQTTGNTSLSSIDSKATTGNTNTAGIRTDLGTDGTSPPSLPGGATGVRGWLRWLGQSAFQLGSGAITAITLRVTLASDGPGATALDSINSKTAGVRAPTTTSVASSASSVTLLTANVSRRGLDIFNNSTATLWVSYTTPAEIPGTSAFAIDPGGSLTRDAQLIGTGALYGIWTSANGTAQVTEWV